MWARTAETAGRVRSTRRRFQARLAAPPLWVFRPAPIGSACGDAPRLCPLTHRAREWWPLRSTRLRLPGSASPRSACRSDRVHHRRTCRWSRRGSPGSPAPPAPFGSSRCLPAAAEPIPRPGPPGFQRCAPAKSIRTPRCRRTGCGSGQSLTRSVSGGLTPQCKKVRDLRDLQVGHRDADSRDPRDSPVFGHVSKGRGAGRPGLYRVPASRLRIVLAAAEAQEWNREDELTRRGGRKGHEGQHSSLPVAGYIGRK